MYWLALGLLKKQAIAVGKASNRETETPGDENLWESGIHWQFLSDRIGSRQWETENGEMWRRDVVGEQTFINTSSKNKIQDRNEIACSSSTT